MQAIAKYLLRYSIFLLLIASALFYWNNSQPAEKIHPLSWIIFGAFAIAYFLNHIYLLNAENKKAEVFIRRFMGTTVLRLFVFIIIIMAYALTHKTLARLFIWHILVFYFFFTVFEVALLYNHFKRKN
jgi:cobalamin biosynthesis protein CobD/CbiB